MNFFCHVILCILLLTTNSLAAAEAALPPDFKINVIVSESDKKEGFQFDFENPNSKAIYCRQAYLSVYIGPDSTPDECMNLYYAKKSLIIGDFELGPKGDRTSSFTTKILGKDDLKEFGKQRGDDENIEYCARGMPTLNCGFNCPDGKKYGQDWTVNINTSGYKKYICNSDGLTTETEVYCDSTHKPFTTWSEDITNGTKNFTCESSGNIKIDYSCLQSPRHELNALNQCVPAACGSIPHGSRSAPSDVPYGKETSLCSYGQWTDTQLTCNFGSVKDNGFCRPRRACGDRADGEWYTLPGTPCDLKTEQKLEYLTNCDDGREIKRGRNVQCTCRWVSLPRPFPSVKICE